ncbi:hypothetical protein [Paenibacillus sp. MMS18-CY102]|uniref:hypothetical protein n=1 Tax=Paenibacillus sp. MMS18-CY102 TaxID=2682849 RepID=UPI0013654289|nr:hypothetical protein [Paenibacillus sp. MMS18-CY102]MWC28575.1 hypothetical protein [Paenibacillus sp. MMS18-CY102]
MKDTGDVKYNPIIGSLSSRTGDRTQQSNQAVAEQCLADPALLMPIAEALSGKDNALVGDCCEVMALVAAQQPELVAPYTSLIVALLSSKTTKVRWEAMHAFSLAVHLVPETAVGMLTQLQAIIQTDKSVIVRDYATDALGNMARANREAAQSAYPLLREALLAMDGKHAGRALAGLCHVIASVPALAIEARAIAEGYLEHGKPVVRKAAKALAKACDKSSR